MGRLQEAFERHIKDTPKLILAKVIDKKLADQNVALSERDKTKLVDHILNGDNKSIKIKQWKWWEREKSITLKFDDEDYAYLEQASNGLEEALPSIIDDVTTTSAGIVLNTLRKKWRVERWRSWWETVKFKRLLFRKWKDPLENLKMLLTIAREYGDTQNREIRAMVNENTGHLADVLTRLHARSCVISDEIISLLSSGFPDGAMARWRSLHEVATVALFISDGDEELAERYVLHQHVESWRAARDYIKCQDALGYEPLSDEELQLAEQNVLAVKERFGANYVNQYGWASNHLNNANPKFTDIERAVGINHYRAHYRMASHGVHANPKGVFFQMGLIDELDVILAGPSNFGLSDPGQCAALSLLQASTSLIKLNPTLDHIITIKIMRSLADDITGGFGALK